MKTQESHIIQTEWYVDWERKFQNILSVCKIRIKLQCVEQYTKKKSCLQFLKIWKARFDAFLFIWGLVIFTDFHDFIFCHCYMLQDVINTYISLYVHVIALCIPCAHICKFLRSFSWLYADLFKTMHAQRNHQMEKLNMHLTSILANIL